MSDVNSEHAVVVNHEKQYSVWPVDRKLPAGWSLEGQTGSKEECLAWIDTNWTDIRPLSLRQSLPMTMSSQVDVRPTANQTFLGGSRDTEK